MARNCDRLWLNIRDESVEVNQRALIEKILARYSGEYTVFRELLQNSDDAQSPAVEIRFETAEYLCRKDSEQGVIGITSLPNLKSTHVSKWTFRNNGIAFGVEDWTRLRRIAEGNPDEEKIGAFGVGFYSLFSVTEDPLVSSGGHCMLFYWKDGKDQLNVRRGDLPLNRTTDPWTTFEMKLRESGPMPSPFDLMRFLASSITFLTHLNDVSVYFDEHRIGQIKKSPGVAKPIDLPGALKRSSQSSIMNIRAVQSRSITTKAEVMHAVYAVGTERRSLPEVGEPPKRKGGFFSTASPFMGPSTVETVASAPHPSKDPIELREMKVTLTVFTAEVDVTCDKKLSGELIRSTKKNPPARLKYDLIYTGKDEYDQSLADDKEEPGTHGSIFRGLRADLNGATNTRIFIGHATGQTTGMGGHMASYFIPTVERESIDFVDRNIAIWNKELLYVGGFVARVAYESELSGIHEAWVGATHGTPDSCPPHELQSRLQEDFIHMLKFFTFHPSTPSSEVAQLLEASFYGCSTAPLRMLSSVGVREALDVKEHDPIIAKFLKGMPMFPQSIIHKCGRIVRILQSQGFISPVTFSDVLYNLRQHRLNKEELVSFLRWRIGLKQDDLPVDMAQLLDATVVSNVDGNMLQLSTVGRFIDPHTLGGHLPQDSPLPASILPQAIAKQFTFAELGSFGWQEFTVVDWLQHITTSAGRAHDFTLSPIRATRVMAVLTHIWSSSSNDVRRSVKELLRKKKCIPTSRGLVYPEQSYLPGTSSGLFCDLNLPMVQFCEGLKINAEIEAVLSFIGVRKHVDPELILERMAATGNWNIPCLIEYLSRVQEFLSADEIAKLQSAAIFPKESTLNDITRHCARDLYAPIDVFRQLKLPVIHWDEQFEWLDDSKEAELLFLLGLHDYPCLEEIVDLCSSKDAGVRGTAFWYLSRNLTSKYSNYDPYDFGDVAFIPAKNNGVNRLEKLGGVFLGTQWAALGFSVIQDDYRNAPTSKLGVQQHPSTSVLLSRLERTPPPNEDAARLWFETLFERMSTFEPHELVRLSKLPIVPTNRPGDQKWITPTQCYIGEGTPDSLHSKLFHFVNFGDVANRFLGACGSRNEPTVADVAERLVDDPNRFRELAGGEENFLAQLRNLAVNKNRILNTTLRKMKFGPILLGKKTLVQWNHHVHKLGSAKEIVIADDINAYHLFRDAVSIAPQEELLEDFYVYLGCKRLSDVVQEQCDIGDEIFDTKTCSERRSLILERLAIFFHEYTYAKSKVTIDWLFNPDNFKVRMCKKLSISKTLIIGDITRPQEVSAGAKWVERGRIELWLANDTTLDMYDVSTSLCRLLFGTVKFSESLLFSTILSADLNALRRRCNVDMILQRLEKYHPKAGGEEKVNVMAQGVSGLPTTTQDPHHLSDVAHNPGISMPPSSLGLHQPAETLQRHVTKEGSSAPSTSLNPHPPQTPESFVEERKAADAPEIQPRCSSTCVNLPAEASEAVQRAPTPQGCPARSTKHKASRIPKMLRNLKGFTRSRSPGTIRAAGRSCRPQQHVIPLDDIRARIDMAIKACNPEEGQVVCRANNTEAKQSSSDHYCHDVFGKNDNLEFIHEFPVNSSPSTENPKTVKVFATRDVPDRDKFIESKRESLSRFVNIVVPIAEAYGLPTTCLNIFYDLTGRSIAFNRRGSLFLNLRYFEEWHDRQVENDNLQQAQISWFFTLAHEIAHNLVEWHNSEHVFWFAAICEAKISTLKRILGPEESC